MASLPSGATLGAQIKKDIGAKAPIASPTFTGTPQAPTPAVGDSSKKIATTAFVRAQIAADTALVTSAAGHNGIYRGKDLTSVYTIDQLSAKVQKGDFSDLFIGDYITKPVTVSGTTYNANWIFADFDYQINNGDTACTAHHIVMIPHIILGTAKMNDTDIITGGYVGSKMWKTTIPAVATGLKNAFGTSHVLSFRTLLTNTVSTTAASMAGAGRVGCSTEWAWYDCLCNLMSEPQVYGTHVHGSSFYDIGERKNQFSLFRHDTHAMNIRSRWWLSAVGYSYGFCFVYHYGDAIAGYSSDEFGVRPYFLFH